MASINSQLTTGKKEKGVGNGTVKRITVVPAQMKVLNPYGTPEDNTADDPIEVFNESKVSFLSIGDPMPPSRRDDSMASLDLISPLSPKMKGTFMDKLPTWHETSQSVSPETLLNIHAGRGNNPSFKGGQPWTNKILFTFREKSSGNRCQRGG